MKTPNKFWIYFNQKTTPVNRVLSCWAGELGKHYYVKSYYFLKL